MITSQIDSCLNHRLQAYFQMFLLSIGVRLDRRARVRSEKLKRRKVRVDYWRVVLLGYGKHFDLFG